MSDLSELTPTKDGAIRFIDVSPQDESNPGKTEELDEATPIKIRHYYKAEINLRWRQAFKAVMAVCHLIAEAHSKLSPDEWEIFVQEDCPFSYSTIQKLIKMAGSPRLNDPNNESLMPSSWTCIYEIMQMQDATFHVGVERGIIHSGCTLEDLKDLRKELEEPKRRPISRSHSEGANLLGCDSVESCSVPTEAKKAKAVIAMDSQAREAEDLPVGPWSEGIVPQDVPAKSYENEIAIYLTPRTSKQYTHDALALKKAITKLADGYAFIQCVDLHIRG